LVLACYSSGIRYNGVLADPVVEAKSIEAGNAALPGPELGVISATCEVPRESLLDGISYGDLSCSEDLLRASMRETAAFVGGTHLRETHCVSEGRRLSCTTQVVRAEGAKPRGEAPLPRRPPFDPFSIEVRLVPKDDVVVRRGPDAPADMVPRLPVSDDLVGELRAHCDRTCDAAKLRDAIALGARHAGADHFGYPACRVDAEEADAARNLASRCKAWASAYRVDVLPRPE
jgi:hypothetical protein